VGSQTETAKRPSKVDLLQYLRLKKRRAEHYRDARQLEREMEPLKEKIEAYTRQETRGKKGAIVNCCGHVLRFITKRGAIPWKDVAIAECSEQTIKKYQDEVPDVEYLDVVPKK